MKKYKGYLIDLDGTMYRGKESIDGAADFVEALNREGIPYLFVTNNSSKTQEDVSNKLNKMGIKSLSEQIVTTSLATANYVQSKKKHARCFVIGEEGLRHALESNELIITDEKCDFVIIGIDRQVTYEKFVKACLAVRSGATFISTNGDIAIPTERGLLPGNGALTSVVSVSTGVVPLVIGKPEAIIMQEALEILGLTREETLMVGDNYNTDIRAGINAGMDTLMVFTGVTSVEELEKVHTHPTYQVNDLRDWIDYIK